MEDLDLHPSLLTDLHRLPDSGDDVFALVPHMGGVEAAAGRHDLGQLDQVGGGLVAVGRIDERAADAEGTGLHGEGDIGFHFRQLRRRGGAGAVSHHVHPGLGRTVIAAEVDGDTLPLQPGEVGGDLSAGTGVPPSPPMRVVTPMRSLFSAAGLSSSTSPEWSIMSIQPG